ncbi:hypothetical protein [Marinactinospora rubrisoli]|uniref:Uncharacterized protein n=1 Tax=Marinactinospora rubrisoli TaxID=2715399 RepID=A0ABW2KG39_9ACTN
MPFLDLMANILFIPLAITGLVLLPRLAPERRGLTATAMVLFVLFALARFGMLMVPPPLRYAGTTDVAMTAVSILASLLMGAAIVLLIVAACRRPAAARPHPPVAPPPPGPAHPAPGPSYGGRPTTPPPAAR